MTPAEHAKRCLALYEASSASRDHRPDTQREFLLEYIETEIKEALDAAARLPVQGERTRLAGKLRNHANDLCTTAAGLNKDDTTTKAQLHFAAQELRSLASLLERP